jgi:SpoVK/Ycf46/Vps4 family AAA+-type ATPase
MLASSARFISLGNGKSPDANIQHHIQLQLKALGKTASSKTPELVTRFDTRYLNASGRHSAERIAEALARTRRGTVLLTGMPGTGKTQLASHMAERCNMELIYRTAADINDKYYGESERNVAKLFEQCDIQNQIIFLDEADTLLMARREDSHRADRAVTSEFLRRLEAFQGIFMCATNHGDLLDPALMRRFVFRLDFAPLNQMQRTQLLQELLGGTDDIKVIINDCTQQRLNRLDRLTPGDFANCKKRLTCLEEKPIPEQWLEELELEHNVKPLVRGRVGFL